MILGGVSASLLIAGITIYLQPATPPVLYAHVPVVSPVAIPSPAVRSTPIRLQIPKIKVDADIKALGVTNGNMDAPANISDVGWYKYGPHPGDIGSAVIVGHFGTLNGKRSVFSDLRKLTAGDVLSVTDDSGKTTSYVVREKRIYPENATTTDIFGIHDGSHLNLITCTGTWSKTLKRYNNRLVVFTDKVK